MNGFHIFISNISISIYSYVPILFLGFFTNNHLVGVYAIIEKTVAIFNGVLAPVSQVLYPHITKKIQENRQEAIILIKKVLQSYVIISLILSIVIILFAPKLLYLISKDTSISSNYAYLLQIFSLSIVISRIGEVFGAFTLVGFGHNKLYLNIMLISSILSIVISLILIPIFKLDGAVCSYIISIFLIVLLLFVKSKKILNQGL